MHIDEEDDEDMGEWEALRTIEEFDYVPTGTEAATTREIDGGDGGAMEMVPLKPLTPVSLLVESLLQQLCNLLEVDSVRSQLLYKSICEQLQQMNLIDDSWEMGEFEAMRSQYQRALFQLVAVARGQDLPQSLQTVWPLASARQLDWSRYHRDFEEIEFIAGGGFGKVYRSRNRLDGIEYAIKKVLIRSTSVDKVLSHLKEVRTFAGLNHVNIVPYKAAWMEPLMSYDGDSVLSNMNQQEDTESLSPAPNSTVDDTENDSVIFAAASESNNNHVPPLEWTNTQSRQSHRVGPNRTISIEEHQPHVKLRWAMLYIQMSLCQLTLREWMDRRNSSQDFSMFYAQFISEGSQSQFPCLPATPNSTDTPKPEEHLVQVSLEIFQQLINGLRYIHECRIVHHDIKPSNVFVGVSNCGSLIIQLGDFGLACPLESSHRDGAMGTPLYAAPEQLDGQCDPKSDIYSLGIILLELLIPFTTDMERARVMDDAKHGRLPSSLPPQLAQLILRLLDKPSVRPSSAELCVIATEMLVNRGCGVAIAELERRLSEKDEEILNLKSQVEQSERYKDIQLKTKDMEILELHMRYEEEKKTREEEIRVLRERLNSVTVKEGTDEEDNTNKE
ncbi:eukaryotic translation initiation factor 2-alpha kinase 1-like [Lutzomyia longipalpis]|uniref:eukaryotic translation initiation factor 2-alpha kinase 1-like n=1 Tax=Lutzomyia longipalpis TaxID=7200 RepID=UPI002483A7C5|nr:eukaryotic translation initiation factor 2-alpha kinase 1-like [Lutzomyia longipalpis]